MLLYASIKDSTKTSLGVSRHPKGQISHMHGVVPAVEKLYLQIEKDDNTKVCCSCCLVAKLCLTLCDPHGLARQAPLSLEFSRQEYRSGLPFPSPGDLPNPVIEPRSPALQADSLLSEPLWKPYSAQWHTIYLSALSPGSRWCLGCGGDRGIRNTVLSKGRATPQLHTWLSVKNVIPKSFHFSRKALSAD